jgi:hypothetical protein
MVVDVTFSLTNGGAALTSDVSHGNCSNGQVLSAKEIFIRHSGSNPITGCGLYIRQYSDTYSGDASAALDIAEILGWGDVSTVSTFGGFQINMNATGSYPAADWPTYLIKTTANGYGYVCKTGTADSEGNAVLLTTTTGASAVGQIAAGGSPNVRFQCRIQTPTAEDTLGVRQFDQVLVYTYTS